MNIQQLEEEEKRIRKELAPLLKEEKHFQTLADYERLGTILVMVGMGFVFIGALAWWPSNLAAFLVSVLGGVIIIFSGLLLRRLVSYVEDR